MQKRRIILFACCVVLLVLGLQWVIKSQAQSTSRCLVNVPSEWGTYRGEAGGFGLVFEDSSGTLRFVKQMPCGLEGAPNVVLELRRK